MVGLVLLLFISFLTIKKRKKTI
ncbi:hypothetical protein ACEWL1_09130 [Polaribacter sp. MF5-112]